MQFDESIVPDRARFRFNLYLPCNNGTPMMAVVNGNQMQIGATWQINWTSVLDQNLPRGAKFLVTHRFLGQSTLLADPTSHSGYVVCAGLPGVQSSNTAFSEYSLPGQVINFVSLTTNAFDAAVYSFQYAATPSKFVCSNPGASITPLSLSFWNLDGNGQAIASALPIEVLGGAHHLCFELVSDE